MKLEKKVSFDVTFDVAPDGAHLYFGERGVMVMVSFPDSENEDDEFLLTWEEIENCARASVMNVEEGLALSANLRQLASRIETVVSQVLARGEVDMRVGE